MGSIVEERELFKIPGYALSNLDIWNYVKKLHVKYFQGIFMRDEIKKIPHKEKLKKYQSFIFNLQTSEEPGIHWVLFFKNPTVGGIYFDSYGELPPKELSEYVGSEDVTYIVYNRI